MALNVVEMAQLIKLYQERTGITDDMIAGSGGGGGRSGDEVNSRAFLFVIKWIVVLSTLRAHSNAYTHAHPHLHVYIYIYLSMAPAA